MNPDSVDGQHGQGKPDLFFEFRDFGNILYAADHVLIFFMSPGISGSGDL